MPTANRAQALPNRRRSTSCSACRQGLREKAPDSRRERVTQVCKDDIWIIEAAAINRGFPTWPGCLGERLQTRRLWRTKKRPHPDFQQSQTAEHVDHAVPSPNRLFPCGFECVTGSRLASETMWSPLPLLYAFSPPRVGRESPHGSAASEVGPGIAQGASSAESKTIRSTRCRCHSTRLGLSLSHPVRLLCRLSAHSDSLGEFSATRP